jgi:signal transduction histidine kinase
MTAHESPWTELPAPSLAGRPRSGIEALSDEFRFLRGLVQGLRCGVVTIDAAGRLLLLNEHARRILGLAREPLPGTLIEHALGAHPELTRVLRESFHMTSPPNRAELELVDGRGVRRTIGFTITLVADDGVGVAPAGAAMFFKDLTPIEQREGQERLKDRLAALGEMAASMAHEIRNPLAAIEISCGLLRRRVADDPRSVDLLDKVGAEVRRVARTVNSSLEYVRPVSPSLGPADLPAVLDEAIAVAAERVATGARIVREYPERLPPFLMDRVLMREVVVNLVVNALEAVGDHGTVTVSAEVTPAHRDAARTGGVDADGGERHAVITVADDGPGIPEEALERVFHPFFTTKQLGSGVGLAVARKIVDRHRGSLDVANRAGRGAVFTVRLPLLLESTEV